MARLGLYQPFIEDRNVRRLYRLKVEFLERSGRKVPMTALVNRILDDFFDAGLPAPSGEDNAQPRALASAIPLFTDLR
jgi:predicted YcjX-like family ATPase